MASKKPTPVWRDVKAKLADYDCTTLLVLVHDLYAASKDNQRVFHARFMLEGDPIKR